MPSGDQGEIVQQENVVSLAGDETASHAFSQSEEKLTTYKVKFGEGSPQFKKPADTLDLIGRGQIAIGGKSVVLSGSRSRFSNDQEQIHIPLSRILNAERLGQMIRFRVEAEGANASFAVQFKVASAAEAEKLGRQLPGRQTEAFARHHAELREYHARLMKLSPRAPVAPTLVAINVLVFVAMCIGGVGFFAPNGADVVRWGSNFGPLTMGGQWWRLFTSLFVHFGVIHLALNMFVLLSGGATIERLFGSARFLLLYLVAGLSGSLASLLWNPLVNSAGASGAIFGIFGGLLAFVVNPRNGVPAAVMTEQRNNVLVFALYNLGFGFAHSGIDNAAHVGGLVGGFVMGFVLARPLRRESRSTFGAAQCVAGLVAGVLIVSLMSWPLVHPSKKVLAEQQFQVALGSLSTQEAKVNDIANGALEKARSGGMSAQGYAVLLQRDVVPAWVHIYAQLSAPKLDVGDSQFDLQKLLLRYADDRRRMYGLMAQALLQNDNALMEQAKDAKTDAEAALDQLGKMKSAKR
jgi:rhomboid protease GluP